MNHEFLKYGAIGLSFLLAFLSFHLLYKEQAKKAPNRQIMLSIYLFMVFSLILCFAGFSLDFFKENNILKVQMNNAEEKIKIIETQNQLKQIQKELKETQRRISDILSAKSGLIEQLELVTTPEENAKKFFNKIIENLKNIDKTIKESLKTE